MRKLALLLAFVLLPAQAWALSTSDLLSIIAMPLAVAAVSDSTGVQADRLGTFVAALNQANVPPTQVVEVVRYVPVALVVQNNQQPDFVQYVQTQVSDGVTGDALVNAIVNQLQTNYDITPRLALPAPAITYVVSDNYVPPVVLTRLGLTSNDLVATAVMPLAVAAISNVAGVPQDELANLVATLNNANVPPVQVVQVLRYVPVALVVDNGQPFVQYVQQQVAQGVIGPALVPVVVQELRTYYPAQTQIVMPAPPPQQIVVDESNFIPPVVVTRVTEVRAHPFGGPPGQIKKQLGLQTGAEVVHGAKPGRQFTPQPVAVAPAPHPGGGHGRREKVPQPMMSSTPAPTVVPPPAARGRGGEKGHGRGHEHVEAAPPPTVAAPPPVAAPAPQSEPPGKAKGNSKGGGKGHGHGKD